MSTLLAYLLSLLVVAPVVWLLIRWIDKREPKPERRVTVVPMGWPADEINEEEAHG